MDITRQVLCLEDQCDSVYPVTQPAPACPAAPLRQLQMPLQPAPPALPHAACPLSPAQHITVCSSLVNEDACGSIHTIITQWQK